ncbi:ABC transporter substrate-binding protein [Halovenus rubra]|uniref:ABC transporter substrate-binding protein n=2 Tax=Halovenus rubra TaxID=869890 RepID=A0ABD5XCX3_9EURY|nr:ABC transporter substrate-binding protein [Halovenus rubra]
MVRRHNDCSESTRRSFVRYGGMVAAGSLLAGCVGGGGDDDSDTEGSSQSTTQTETTTETNSNEETNPTSQTSQEDTSYAASMAPVGELSFEEIPETVVGGWGFVGDVLMALGQANRVVGMSRPGFWYQGFYELLPNVSPRDTTEIPATVSKSYRINEELVYDLDPDLLAVDPNRFINWYGSDTETVSKLAEDIAPFFGNESRSKRAPDWAVWPNKKEYGYYDIPEFVERYGRLFGEQERAAAMVDLYESTIDDITSRLPPESERPSIASVDAFTNPENRGFFGVNNPKPANEKTHEHREYGHLSVIDAFEDKYVKGGHYGMKAGFEELLDINPDVIIFDEAVNSFGGENVYGNAGAYEKTIDVIKKNEVTKQVKAVQDDHLYPGGTGSQGPIINLFQTEMLAKQLHPEEYGKWHGFGEIPAEERLFDRQRVADIINGNI